MPFVLALVLKAVSGQGIYHSKAGHRTVRVTPIIKSEDAETLDNGTFADADHLP